MKLTNKLTPDAVGLLENVTQSIVRPADWYRVTNIDDFEIHVNAHITRVRILGLHIASQFFPEVDLHKLEDYLSLHDAEKLADTPEFRQLMGIEATARPLLENLFVHFGVTRLPRPANEVENFEQVRRKLNEIGSYISRQWMTHNRLWNYGGPKEDGEPTTVGKLFLRVEHLADVLDRELDPIAYHELGKTTFDAAYNPNSADHYVEGFEERRILRLMRPVYAHLVEGNTYRDWVGPRKISSAQLEDKIPLIDLARLGALRKLFATL